MIDQSVLEVPPSYFLPPGRVKMKNEFGFPKNLNASRPVASGRIKRQLTHNLPESKGSGKVNDLKTKPRRI